MNGLCAVHSVFGTVRSTDYRGQTELYHRDAKAFIRRSLGTDYMSFSHIVDDPEVLAELEDLIWFDLIRPASLLFLQVFRRMRYLTKHADSGIK